MSTQSSFVFLDRAQVIRIAIVSFIILATVAPLAYAQKGQTFKVGDIVDVSQFDKTFRGIVTKVSSSNWPTVKYIEAKETTEREEDIELLEGEEFGPGAKVRFERFGKTQEGSILGSEDEMRRKELSTHMSDMPKQMREKFLQQLDAKSKRNSGRSGLPKRLTRWTIEMLVEEESRFTERKTRLVRRPSRLVDPYVSRKWTDATGKFNVQAKFISLDDNSVELERENGKELKIPLKKLSRKDKVFLKTVAKQQADNPNASTSSEPPTLHDLFLEIRAIQSLPPKLLIPELSTSENIPWNVSPDPATQSESYHEVELPSVIIGRKSAHNSLSGIHASTPGGAFAIGVVNELEKTSAALIWHPGDAKATKFPIVQEDAQLFAISPDGKLVVGAHETGSKEATLFFWDFQSGSAIDTWNIGRDAGKSKFAPVHGRFIGDKRLVTLGKYAICWDLSDPKSPEAIYAIEILNRLDKTRFAFSANNKLLAIENRDHEIYFIDPISGKFQGALTDPFKNVRPKQSYLSTSRSRTNVSGNFGNRSVTFKRVSFDDIPVGAFAFSPNGERFAGMTRHGEIFVWDLKANELVGKFFAATEDPNRLNWADNDHLLIDNKLVNVTLGAAVWEIALDDSIGSLEQTSDGKIWGLSRYALTPLELIPESLSEQVEKLQLKREDLLAISPESKIAIKWTLPNFHHSDSVKQENPSTRPGEKLKTNVTRNGQVLDDSAKITVVSTLDREKANRLRISDIISEKVRGFVEEKRKRATIECRFNDEVLWSKSRTFGTEGISIQSQGNETFQQTVDRICTPTRSFYSDFYVPEYFYRLPNGKVLGKSVVKKSGVTFEK